MDKGYIQVYTGNGKGKTTAALGLILRAVGSGKKVLLIQFMKYGDYSEIKSLNDKFPEVTVLQFGNEEFIIGKPTNSDVVMAMVGLSKATTLINTNNYDLVILDEINVAINLKLLKLVDVIEYIKNKPSNVELVLTGRNAHAEIIEHADLVSEINEIKHYYNNGVRARVGIEK